MFTGLRERAKATSCAIVLITHLRKEEGGEALLQVLGSIDIVGAARSVLLVGRDPTDANQRHLLHIKSNVRERAGALGYRLTANPDDPNVADFVWTGPSSMTEDELLNRRAQRTQPDVMNAVDLIRHLLSEGPRLGSQVRKALSAQGVSSTVIGTACNQIGVRYTGGFPDTLWHLPLAMPRATG